MAHKKQRRAQQTVRAQADKPVQTSREPVAEKTDFIPLVNCDSVHKTLQLAQYNASLLECIRLIHTHEYGLHRPRLRELTLLAWQVAHLVDIAALHYLDKADATEKMIKEFLSGDARDDLAVMEDKPHSEASSQPDYRDTLVRTRRVMVLHRALMACLHDITRGDDDALKPYLGDLTALAREISLTVRQSLGQTLRY